MMLDKATNEELEAVRNALAGKADNVELDAIKSALSRKAGAQDVDVLKSAVAALTAAMMGVHSSSSPHSGMVSTDNRGSQVCCKLCFCVTSRALQGGSDFCGDALFCQFGPRGKPQEFYQSLLDCDGASRLPYFYPRGKHTYFSLTRRSLSSLWR